MVLRAHRERREAESTTLGVPLSDRDLIFAHADGTPFNPSNVTHAFTALARRAGLHGTRLHDLRHTHASLLLRQGVHLKVVQERLGHASIAITGDIYSHVLPGLQEDAALRLDLQLAPERPAPVSPVVSKMLADST